MSRCKKGGVLGDVVSRAGTDGVNEGVTLTSYPMHLWVCLWYVIGRRGRTSR
jgi:hypothetical protein